MPAHRFFLEDLLQHPTVVIKDPELHHLKHVMRVKLGENVELINGKGVLATARLCEIRESEAILEIEKKTSVPPPSEELILAQALLRPALLDWVVEKGTELGATQFWLFPGDWSEKKELSSSQLERLHQLAISATKQCGRLYLPKIETKLPLSEWNRPTGSLLFGSLSPSAKLLEKKYPSPVIIVIGPEKGLSPEEQTVLETRLQAIGVTLHPNTLRAETAALCALSLLSYRQPF